MASMLERITLVENLLHGEVLLVAKVWPANTVRKTIPVNSGGCVEIGATEFCMGDINPEVFPTIWIYVDGFNTGRFLQPTDFVSYGKIKISLDENSGEIKLSGVKARLTDLGRIRCLSWFFGRPSYWNDREEEIIV
ncbi:hypothetical protein RJ641_005196 [Dillenia turbinata]|uniref:Uncharacterized protein n=1 Tax=Dillenia turbinata TaxID=194707 RepID=A0AAN8VFM3_9MAGN